MTEKLYYRLCQGLTDVGSFHPLSVSPYDVVKTLDKEVFRSVYLYTKEQIEEAEKKVEVMNSQGEIYTRLRGVGRITLEDGTQFQTIPAKSNQLIFDFDDESNPENARKDAIELVNRLRKHGIPDESIDATFSGGKGKHIKVPINQFLTATELKSICSVLTDGLETTDSKVYNDTRILRLPGSKHHSGFYCTQISLEELENNTVDEIKKIAVESFVNEDLQSVDIPDSILEMKDLVVKNKINGPKAQISGLPEEFDDIDFSKKPTYLTPAKYVLECGYIPLGYGQDARMILAASYKKAGKDARQAYHALKSVSEHRTDYYGIDSKFDTDELWCNVIEAVYSPSWQGGTYNNFHPLLSEIEGRLPAYLNRKDRAKIIDNASVFDKFKSFARDIDKNTLKFGIKELDDNLRLLAGTSVGILGTPGCHAKDSGILMFDGSVKKVQDVEVGDWVMGPDSEPREVLQLCRGKEKMVRFTPYRSEPFTVNMNHILNLSPSKLKQKGRIPGNLNITVENYIQGIENKSATLSGYRLHKKGADFNKKDVTIDPYFLGLWLGDGHSENTSITTADDVTVDYLTEYATTFDTTLKVGAKTGKASTYRITTERGKNNPLLTFLQEYNLIKNKHIPKAFLTHTRVVRLKVLAGLIDSDGCLEWNGKSWEITQKNKRLAKDIQFLSRSLGYHCSMNEVEKYCIYKGEKRSGIYQQMIITPMVDEVPVRVERRKLTGIVTSKNINHYGFNYEILEEDDYFGFTLSGDHLYLTEDFIVHHNSGKSTCVMNLLANNSLKGEKGIFYSLDMGESLVALKQVQRVARLTNDQIFKMVREDKESFKKIEKKAQKDFENVQFSFKFGITPDDIRNDIKEYEDRTGEKIRLVVVDYLENIQSGYTDPTVGSGAVAQQLADIANEMNVLMVVLLQTQKAVKPSEEIYSMRQIKGSSLIEQGLSVAIGIFREGQSLKYKDYDCTMTINVLKNRYGDLSTSLVGWEGARSKITDITKDQRLLLAELRDQKKEDEEEAKEKGW